MIETARLVLAPAGEADIDAIMAVERDPANSDFILQGSREQHLAEIASPDIDLLTARAKDGGRLLGFVLVCRDRRMETVELRRFAVTEKGRGYGREVCAAVIRHAFEVQSANRLWLDVCHDNRVGIALYEKLGMHLDGELREHVKADRGYISVRIYSVLKAEYPGLRDRL